jgi:hypothetical protein
MKHQNRKVLHGKGKASVIKKGKLRPGRTKVMFTVT